jgi:fluoride ion exporter CrcB/FEX
LTIAVGAILRYAVNANTSGIKLPTAGLILIIVGCVAVAIGLLLEFAEHDRSTRPR